MAKKTTIQAKKKTKPKVSDAARVFMKLVTHFTYQQGPQPQPKGLTKFTFFAGAGFSKSWDPKAPTGSELFTIKSDVIEQVAHVGALARMFGLHAFDGITPDQLRQIIYQIDMQERYPDVRSRYVDEQNIRMFRGALRAAVLDRYEKIASLNYFDVAIGKFPLNSPTDQQQKILSFFRHLRSRMDGSQGSVEGIRTHFITTNYDFVIETILDNVIEPDDSLFLYNYRGFTPKKIINESNIAPVHEHWLVQHVLKINGGFEILRRGEDYVLDYSMRSPAQVISEPPILMLGARP